MAQNDAIERDDRRASLDAFANTRSNQPVSAPAVRPLAAPADRVFGAQAVAVYRDEARILQKLSALGAAAGSDWFYRYPVKNKKQNRTDWIEGASIKLANDVARIYGNCDVDVRVIDIGDSWLFYARFNDFESGYSLTRPFQQQKGAGTIGGDDNARRLDIAFQIGASKAIRNVVVNALQTYSDYAFDQARNSLVERIGKEIDRWRDRTVQGIANLGVDLVRVETVLGRSAKDWTAPDVAKVIAMMKAISDGMATVDDTFPSKDAKPARTLNETLDELASKKNDEPSDPETGKLSADTATPQPVDPSPAAGQPAPETSGGPLPDTTGAGEAGGNKSKAKAKPDEGNAGDLAPETAAQYRSFATAWIAAADDADAAEARWKQEKKYRNSLNVEPGVRDELEAALKAKVAGLRKGE